VATDVVLFTIQEHALKVLLVRRALPPFQGSWALPGGFVRPGEDLEACARRELGEETGVTGFYLEQLYTFGAPDRDPRGRIITVAYYALIPADRVVLHATTDADAAAWFPVSRLPDLAFDHGEIVAMARSRLSAKIDYTTVAFQFLPDAFTLAEVQAVYETVKGAAIDKRNFRKAILALGKLKPTGKLRREGAHRPARLYRVSTPHRVEIIR